MTFWQLVRQAHMASEEVDAFDLRSEDPASVETFGQLVYLQAAAAAALIKHVKGMSDGLRDQRKREDTADANAAANVGGDADLVQLGRMRLHSCLVRHAKP